MLKKYFEKHITPKKESKSITFVDSSFPLHRYWFYSSPQSSNHLDTIRDSLRFYRKIPSSLINNFEHRLYFEKYGWNEDNLLKKNFPNLNITNSKGNISLESQLNKSRLCVVNYHSTLLMQCIAADYPIVCYWDFNQWNLRESVMSLYVELQNVGILHSSPQSAANFIKQYHCNIDSWWNDNETINAKKAYAYKFCRFDENPEKKWAMFFKKLLI